MKLTISLGQMDIAQGDVDANLAKMKHMTIEAARRGSDLVLFPELWSTGYDLANTSNHASEIDQGVFAETAALANRYGISIAGSNLSLLGEGRYGNTAVFFGPDGACRGVYTKLHLFSPMEEIRYLTAGDHLEIVATGWGKAAMAICYDLRFPELTRWYAAAGASLILIPAEWPHPRLFHWQTMLRARAIENQLFLAACNCVGRSGDTSYCGHSSIIGPDGEIVIEAGEGEMLVTATIDLEQIEASRSKFNILADRRSDLYG